MLGAAGAAGLLAAGCGGGGDGGDDDTPRQAQKPDAVYAVRTSSGRVEIRRTGAEQPLATLSQLASDNLSLSPDRRSVYFLGRRQANEQATILRAGLDLPATPEAMNLPHPGPATGGVGVFALAPGGLRAAYIPLGLRDIYSLDLARKESRLASAGFDTSGALTSFFRIEEAWSPDGRFLSLRYRPTRGLDRVLEFDSDSAGAAGASPRRRQTSQDVYLDARWQSDSNRLVVSERLANGRHRVGVCVRSDPDRLLRSAPEASSALLAMKVHASSPGVLYLGSDTELRHWDSDSGLLTSVATGVFNESFWFSADGRQVLFARAGGSAGQELMLRRLGTSNSTRLSAPLPSAADIAQVLALAGDHVLFRTAGTDNNLYRTDLSTGTAVRMNQLAPSSQRPVRRDVALSSNGAHALYLGDIRIPGRFELFSTALAAPGESQLLSAPLADGESIAAFAPL